MSNSLALPTVMIIPDHYFPTRWRVMSTITGQGNNIVGLGLVPRVSITMLFLALVFVPVIITSHPTGLLPLIPHQATHHIPQSIHQTVVDLQESPLQNRRVQPTLVSSWSSDDDEPTSLLAKQFPPPPHPPAPPPSITESYISSSTFGSSTVSLAQKAIHLVRSTLLACRDALNSLLFSSPPAQWSRTSVSDTALSGAHIIYAGRAKDLTAFPWMTYRHAFPPITASGSSPSTTSDGRAIHPMGSSSWFPPLTTDAGWGCMIRVGQMMLATALYRHYHISPPQAFSHSFEGPLEGGISSPSAGNAIPTTWSPDNSTQDPTTGDSIHHILSWFQDSYSSPYSIHRITELGHALTDKEPGEWYGPSTIAHVLAKLVAQHPQPPLTIHPGDAPLSVVVGIDGVVYKDTVTWELNQNRAVLLLIPQKIGSDKSNPLYFDSILACLDSKFSVGIGGGKRKSSVFFVGYQLSSKLNTRRPNRSMPSSSSLSSLQDRNAEESEEPWEKVTDDDDDEGEQSHAKDASLIFLDPHWSRPSIPPRANDQCRLSPTELDSYCCRVVRLLPIQLLDPSLVIGFYIRDRHEWNEFLTWSRRVTMGSAPLFGMAETLEDVDPVHSLDEEEDDYDDDDDKTSVSEDFDVIPRMSSQDSHRRLREEEISPSSSMSHPRKASTQPVLTLEEEGIDQGNGDIPQKRDLTDLIRAINQKTSLVDAMQDEEDYSLEYSDPDEEEELATSRRTPSSSTTNDPQSQSQKRRLQLFMGQNDNAEEDEYVTRSSTTANSARKRQKSSASSPSASTSKVQEDKENSDREDRETERGDETDFGTFESVEMVNFMCHAFVKIDLGPKINFIIGHNGSGKSAILSAITVCLGAKASFTNRGNTFKNFIREGQPFAEITIKIRNRGPDAYRHDIYGNTITVYRKIPREGATAYKLKDVNGRTISTRKEDLVAILDHLGMQIDNPMAVLTQDTARMYLANSTAAQKYAFFKKGTQIAQLEEDYHMAEAKIIEGKKIREMKEKSLPEIKERVARIKRKLEAIDKGRDIETRCMDLKNMLVWAQVEEREIQVEAQEGVVSELKGAIEERLQQQKNAEDQLEGYKTTFDHIQEMLAANNTNQGPLNDRKMAISTELRALRRDIEDVRTEEADLNSRIQHQRSEAKLFEAQIAQETRKLELNTRNFREAQLQQIALKDDELITIRNQIGQAKNRSEEIDQECRHLEEPLRGARDAEHAQGGEVQRLRDEIAQMRQSGGDNLRVFGPATSQVLRIIDEYEAAGRWRGAKPIGPFGSFVKIRDQKYSMVCETLYGRLLNAFGVENRQDRSLLNEIFRRFNHRSDIYIYQNRSLDFAHGQPDSCFLTMHRVLDITNEIVLNQSVINSKIEKNILVETKAEGNRITSNGLPSNCSGVFTVDAFSMGNRSGGLATVTLNKYNGAPRLTANVDQYIQDKEHRLETVARELEDARRAKDRFQLSLDQLRREKQNIRARISGLERQAGQLEREISQLREKLVEADALNIQELEASKREAEIEIENIQRSFGVLMTQKDLLIARAGPLQEDLKMIDRELRQITNQHDAHQMSSNKCNTQINKAKTEVQHWASSAAKYEAKLTEANAALRDLKSVLEEYSSKAAVFCDRMDIPKDMSVARIAKEIEMTEKMLKIRERELGSREEVLTLFTSSQAEYLMARKDIKFQQALTEKLEASVEHRKAEWVEYRSKISTKASFEFTNLMKTRGFTGRLLLNHRDETLELQVESNDKSLKAGVNREKDTKLLSGGEKSFSTICLLLALWKSMPNSFRALDEFDVFMDSVNREMAMKLMISNARSETPKRQYIFITPQGLSNVQSCPDIRINRLSDPERGQRRLVLE